MTEDIEAARTDLIERLLLTDPAYDASFDRIVRLLRAICNSEAAAFTVIEGGRQFYKAHEGMAARESARSGSYCTYTIEQTGILEVQNAHLDPRFAGSPVSCGPAGHSYYAGIPICAPSGLPLGALCILDNKPRILRDLEREALEDLRAVLEEALMLRSLSVVDPLTGLFNRRHFEQFVGNEWSRGFAAQAPVALCILDLDHFKAYNDTFGHAGGDQCLVNVAGAIQTAGSRVGDVIARIGGEEFVLVLPSCDEIEAERIADAVCSAVSALRIENPASPNGYVSITIGAVVVRRPGAEGCGVSNAMRCADEALYMGKELGRNRVTVVTLE